MWDWWRRVRGQGGHVVCRCFGERFIHVTTAPTSKSMSLKQARHLQSNRTVASNYPLQAQTHVHPQPRAMAAHFLTTPTHPQPATHSTPSRPVTPPSATSGTRREHGTNVPGSSAPPAETRVCGLLFRTRRQPCRQTAPPTCDSAVAERFS